VETAQGPDLPPSINALRRTANELRERHPRLERALWCVAGAIVAVLVMTRPLGVPTQNASVDPALVREVVRVLDQRQQASRASAALANVLPSVVQIQSARTEGTTTKTSGTGVVISDKGLVLTNLHVVENAQHIVLRFHDGHTTEAAVVSRRPEHDLAVVQLSQAPKTLTPASISPSYSLTPGDDIIAVGFPFGIGPSVTAGIVSGLGRQHRFPRSAHAITKLIQFDAAVNVGNSGGPLVNMNGDVVGIVTGYLSPSTDSTFTGIGFAVPIEDAIASMGVPPF